MIKIIRLALEEDIGAGDVTSRACVPEGLRARGTFIAREPLVLAGTEVLDQMFDHVVLLKHDGDRCAGGELLATVEGNARTLLERERVALNFLQRLSGVATLARQYADAIAGTNCRVLDTRKTTPGMRALEKRAAAAGGVTNHRMGLFDAVLIKNNHIAAAGGIRQALHNADVKPLADARGSDRSHDHSDQSHDREGVVATPGSIPIEIEVRTLTELHEALDAGAQHLLLDNLTPAEAAAWVREIAGRAKVELSGGITLETVRAYAATGADFVSAGAITHSARAVDISFRLELI
jgi:nicotinate-nucleotide pyrophosphorylase (carboxylating)